MSWLHRWPGSDFMDTIIFDSVDGTSRYRWRVVASLTIFIDSQIRVSIFILLPIIRKIANRHMQHGPGCQSYTSRELPNSRRVSILGFLAKCHNGNIPQIGQIWGGWRYTKQYIIRRDFHGRLHPKLHFLHTEICRFLTPPKMVVFRILAIFVDFAKNPKMLTRREFGNSRDV